MFITEADDQGRECNAEAWECKAEGREPRNGSSGEKESMWPLRIKGWERSP